MNPNLQFNPAIGRLVEHQVRNWELARAQKNLHQAANQNYVQDFVTISREVGVGARQIGAELGRRLGWPVFEKEILQAMAGDDATRERIYASLDERDISWLEEAVRSFMQPEFAKNDYFHQLCRTILSLARQSSAVFIGRRADLILPRDVGLRVRVVAPLEVRIGRLMERRGLSREVAAREIQRMESERAGFTHHYFKGDPHDVHDYDVVVNLRGFTVEQVVDLILCARGARVCAKK